MAINYTNQEVILDDAQYTSRCSAAVASAALAILGEAIGAMTQIQTDKRQALAARVLGEASGSRLHQAFWRAALASVGMTGSTATDGAPGSISDAEIDTAVTSVWDDVAGVLTAERP